ncbi:MAG: hypothetical protein HOC71_17405 [Candidatus Latescibacteria bacterium]|jgi:hypothetical protein|nr:hypothetical protein [Candidatus Latescibacterota bacterium]
MAENKSRRSFLAKGALAGAATLTAGATAEAATQNPGRKLKIGVFGLDYTFWNIWADLLSPEGKNSGTSLLNMVPSHVWDKDQKKAEEFAQKWGCEVVKKYDGMLGKVDGVVNGDLYNVPWQHKLLRPYIEAGVPAYLSRPWSSRLRDLDSMLELAAKHNTPICATATYEHYNEADNFQGKMKNIGEIEAVFATCGAGDRPHFHIPYMMMKILGYNVEEISLMTNDPKKPNYLQSTYVYGATDSQPQYALSMHGSRAYVFSITIVGKEGTEWACMPSGASWFYRFLPQLVDIQKTIDGTNYQPLDIVRKKFECVLTEYYSHYERGGTPVKLGTVPPGWQLPPWRPDWYDDSDFKD